MSEDITEALQSIQDEFEGLERKLNRIVYDIHIAERAAYSRGVSAGLSAREVDFKGKTLLIQVPPDEVEGALSSVWKLGLNLDAKVIVCSDLIEIRELHDLDLKALGLTRIE